MDKSKFIQSERNENKLVDSISGTFDAMAKWFNKLATARVTDEEDQFTRDELEYHKERSSTLEKEIEALKEKLK